MAALTPAVPDKAEILPLVETTLACDLKGPRLPSVVVALNMVEKFTEFGRAAADDLRTGCLSIPADSEAGIGAQATLGQAARLLYLSPPHASQELAAHRAQNLAHLVHRLVETAEEVRQEQERAAGWNPQHARGERSPPTVLSPREPAQREKGGTAVTISETALQPNSDRHTARRRQSVLKVRGPG